MPRHTDWYLVEFERELGDSFDLQARLALIAEAANHLEASRIAFEELGSGPEEADRQAVEAFGLPKSHAKSILAELAQNVQGDRKGKRQWHRPTLFAFAAAGAFPAIWEIWLTQPLNTSFFVTVVVSSLVVLAIISAFSRRVQVKTAALVATGFFFSIWCGLNLFWAPYYNNGILDTCPKQFIPLVQKGSLSRAPLEAEVNKLATGVAFYSTNRYQSDPSTWTEAELGIAGTVPEMEAARTLRYIPSSSAVESQEAWTTAGPQLLKEQQRSLEIEQQIAAFSQEKGLAHNLRVWGMNGLRSLGDTLFVTSILFLVHLIGWMTGAVVRWARRIRVRVVA